MGAADHAVVGFAGRQCAVRQGQLECALAGAVETAVAIACRIGWDAVHATVNRIATAATIAAIAHHQAAPLR